MRPNLPNMKEETELLVRTDDKSTIKTILDAKKYLESAYGQLRFSEELINNQLRNNRGSTRVFWKCKKDSAVDTASPQ